MENILNAIFGFFISDKFYLPILYILIGILIYNLVTFLIVRVSKINVKGRKVDKKKTTIISLFKNIIKYIIGIFVILAILEVYGIDTTKILASLGIVGVVVGLAFQDIIKDLLAGIFIIFDDQYAVGDMVTINGFTGEIVALGLKTTKIKAYTGEVKILSNSSFTEVINYNKSLTKLLVKIPVSYNTSINKLEIVLDSIKEDIKAIENVVGEVEFLGVDELSDSSMVYVIAVDCAAYKHFAVKRQILRLVKETLDNNKIEIPYNKLDIYMKK